MPKIYTIRGESSEDALKQAREIYGDNAIHISTKQIQAKTINKKPVYEIIIAVEEEVETTANSAGKINSKVANYQNGVNKFSPNFKPSKKQEDTEFTKPAYEKDSVNLQSPPKFSITEKQEVEKSKDEDILVSISNATKEINKIVGIEEINQKNSLNFEFSKIDEVAKQVNKLSQKVNLISDMIWDDKSENRNNLAIPPEFASIYKAAKSSGMKLEHLEAIMQTTLSNMPSSMKANPIAVKRYFYSLLRNMLPCRSEKNRQKQKIMMLVGPTGVGKTTTLAKLAARFAYSSEKRYKTGIITLDTYRIGAVEQLFQYAKMMKLQILEVIKIDDFKDAIQKLKNCDVILVDTTGNSQYDREKLDKLDSFLRSSEAQIDVSLVLSAGAKVDDLLEIYNGFSFLDIDTLIITKFDETKHFGNVFSLIYETNTPVSYFCVGQEVPDDLMEAKSDFLVSCVLEGFNKDKL